MSTLLRLDAKVATAFYGQFPKLREAQQAVIEPLLSGQNVVLTSGTGSGKTEAVMAPLVSKHWRQATRSGDLFLIYIAPTKALVKTTWKNDCIRLCRRSGFALGFVMVTVTTRQKVLHYTFLSPRQNPLMYCCSEESSRFNPFARW